jgi:5-amino-6-(5-phosphoribosylamino)uracil reductase
MSLDGYIDDATADRLVLSGAQDLDRVDELRASCDAILVGAGTIRADNPRLLLHSQARRAARIAAGLAADPLRVTITGSGELEASARVFNSGEVRPRVYVPSAAFAGLRARLSQVADVVEVVDESADAEGYGVLSSVLADLAGAGIGRLMVEGGSSTLTQFLTSGYADELQLAVAPFFVGDPRAPSFAGAGRFPWSSRQPARLAHVRPVGNDVLLVYALSERYANIGPA